MFRPASEMDPSEREALAESFQRDADEHPVHQSASLSGQQQPKEEADPQQHSIPSIPETQRLSRQVSMDGSASSGLLTMEEEDPALASAPPPGAAAPAVAEVLAPGMSPYNNLPAMPEGWRFDKSAASGRAITDSVSVLVVGNTSVGKTCFCRKFSGDGNASNTGPTVGVFAYSGAFVDGQGHVHRVQVFDTQGSDRGCRLMDSFLTRCHAVIFVFDLTDRASFENLAEWKHNVCTKGQERNKYRLLADTVLANKADMGGKSVSDAELFESRQALDAPNLYEVSALQFDEDTMQKIVASVVERVLERKARGEYESPVWQDSGLDLSAGKDGTQRQPVEEKKKGGCC